MFSIRSWVSSVSVDFVNTSIGILENLQYKNNCVYLYIVDDFIFIIIESNS